MAGINKQQEAPLASCPSGAHNTVEHRARRRRKMVAKQHGRKPRHRVAAADADAASGSVLDLRVPALDPDQVVGGLRFLLQKELRNSDVSQLGRIVLPKKEAEAHLPCLTSREGIVINMDDLDNLQAWTFKYRFHTAIYASFRAKKTGSAELYVAPADEGIFDSIVPDIVVGSARYSDLFLPLAEGINIAYGYGLSCAFEEDFPMTFLDENTGSASIASHKSSDD
ncbi:hypothetical protein OPV22_014081 [Ensete ventricosum]|uniref:TF-B3 domain-containing protein n=1 Tax=Ensete ventricosum TaxID=4639 RepID=A0AAV8R0U8_ENSVE|nr:hypothetical protein OPV22_014081 [Ensete ventricosum]